MVTAKISIFLSEEQPSRSSADKLYEAAIAVEKDTVLNEEMKDWEITVTDGINVDEVFPIV
jgi:hypothetical protein